MIRVEADTDRLLEWLDEQEQGKLYPQMAEGETILSVTVQGNFLEFVIGESIQAGEVKP